MDPSSGTVAIATEIASIVSEISKSLKKDETLIKPLLTNVLESLRSIKGLTDTYVSSVVALR